MYLNISSPDESISFLFTDQNWSNLSANNSNGIHELKIKRFSKIQQLCSKFIVEKLYTCRAEIYTEGYLNHHETFFNLYWNWNKYQFTIVWNHVKIFYTTIFLFEKPLWIDSIFIDNIWSPTVCNTSSLPTFLPLHELHYHQPKF